MASIRLPKIVKAFPGWSIKVKQVPRSFFAKWVEHPDEVIDGTWDINAMTIYVCKSLNKKAKFKVYSHELGHAHHDYNLTLDT